MSSPMRGNALDVVALRNFSSNCHYDKMRGAGLVSDNIKIELVELGDGSEGFAVRRGCAMPL